MTAEQKRVLTLTDLVRADDRWTTYTAMSLVVYGHERGARAVGTTLRQHGNNRSAHRVLSDGGRVPESWKGDSLHNVGGGPAECIARLKEEDMWDDVHGCARADREINAARLRSLERKAASNARDR